MPETDRWYVAYTVNADRGPRRTARMTRTFDTEEHAKLFAREIVTDSLRLIAGTINPRLPKMVIAASDIEAWMETAASKEAEPKSN